MSQTVIPASHPLHDSTEDDWRLSLPPSARTWLRIWLWSGAGLTFLILIVGGITRLTQSGLSIVDWAPIMGVVPPLNELQWQEAFDRYRQFPEYQQLRRGMGLDEFKFIFFWEYLHRMLARFIGLVFLIPFAIFWLRGHMPGPLLKRTLVLFALGALQGTIGWYMVASGLIDRPHVSHYRLAIHLSIAFAIFGGCLWIAAGLRSDRLRPSVLSESLGMMRQGLFVVGGLLAAQIFYGALVAGLKAGLIHNTFPLMGGGLIPPNLLWLDPLWLNPLENPVAVQWVHRILGTVLGLAAVTHFVRVMRASVDETSRRYNAALLTLIAAQYLLGVLTLLYRVPVGLGVAHQAMAMVIFGTWLMWVHHARELRRASLQVI